MQQLLLTVMFIILFSSCNTQQPGANTVPGEKPTAFAMESGKDYFLLKRFRLEDKQGFYQPLEAVSFLLPANWQTTGAVQWNAASKCLPEMVQASLQAKSPDGAFELMVLPVTQFDWSDDAVYLDAMQKGFNLHSCHISAPQDAAEYISQSLAPQLNAQATSASTINALQQQMDAGAAQMTNAARSAGNNAYSHRGSAAEGVLQFQDGKQGLAFCTLMQTIVSLPGTQGGMANNWQCYVSMRIVIKYTAGNEATARNIMSVFFSSARINPAWGNAVQSYFTAVGRNAQDETWKQVQISHQAQQEISDNITRSWESNNSTANSSSDTNAGFGQYLRGVDSWLDENGNKVELSSGYSNAWSNRDGSYMLSNDPSFDPNVSLGDTQGWERMKR